MEKTQENCEGFIKECVRLKRGKEHWEEKCDDFVPAKVGSGLVCCCEQVSNGYRTGVSMEVYPKRFVDVLLQMVSRDVLVMN